MPNHGRAPTFSPRRKLDERLLFREDGAMDDVSIHEYAVTDGFFREDVRKSVIEKVLTVLTC